MSTPETAPQLLGSVELPSVEPTPAPLQSAPKSPPIEIGFVIDCESAGFIWNAPAAFHRKLDPPPSAKAASRCPAVREFEARYYVVPCPFDLHLRLKQYPDNRLELGNLAGPNSPITAKKIQQSVVLTNPSQWRYPHRPVVQIETPYRFLSDDVVYMEQLPPFLTYRQDPWPGMLIGGRLPIHIWPRSMMWAFEWWEPGRDLILKRGEPWFLVRFETQDPTRKTRLVEAEMTPQLREYCQGLDGVTNYVNQTYSLFDVAKERRPQTLLVPKQRQE
jgi:hypothetical protein